MGKLPLAGRGMTGEAPRAELQLLLTSRLRSALLLSSQR